MVSSVSSMGDNVGDGKVGDDKVYLLPWKLALVTPKMVKMWFVKEEMWVIMVG